MLILLFLVSITINHFIPEVRNVIAIEPMTGAVDNFNNKIGLQTLQPNETYNMKWLMVIETKNSN